MLRINERVLDLVRFTEHPAWPSNQHVGLSAILGSRPSSRDFFLQILSLLPRAWEEGERMEWGRGGGGYSLAEWSARRTCYPQAVPASSPSPTTSLTCLFCRPKFKSTATLANNQLVFSCNWGSCYGFYWIIFFYSFEWSPCRTAGKISALPL